MTKRDPALRSRITAEANAFRFQADVDAVQRAPRSFEAARRKLARAEEEVRRSDVSDGEELLNSSYEAIHAAAQGLACAARAHVSGPEQKHTGDHRRRPAPTVAAEADG